MSLSPILPRLALGVAATASTASGAIVVFDINPDKTLVPYAALDPYGASGIHIGNINLTTGTFSQIVSSTYEEFAIAFTNSGLSIASLRNSSTGLSFIGTSGEGLRVRTYSLLVSGDSVVSPSASWGTNIVEPNDFPSGIIYIGLRLDSGNTGVDFNFGWIEMTDDPVAGKLVTRFAFNDIVGQSIFAGQTTAIPEPSTLGLVGGLFGLVAAAHLRRRKLKQVAASDKFLALAAGEKLN